MFACVDDVLGERMSISRQRGGSLTLALPLLLMVPSGGAQAGSPSQRAFEWQAGPSAYLDSDRIYAAWNAKDPKLVLKPGLKVLFFGRAQGCEVGLEGGPVSVDGNAKFGEAEALTGVPIGPAGKVRSWTPRPDTGRCDSKARSTSGDSFVLVNEDAQRGGIALFTFTGESRSGGRSFFTPFGGEGQNGTGTNAYIEGTFVVFRFDWRKDKAIVPWSEQDKSDERKVEIRSTQSVATASAGDKPAEHAIQVKQQLIVSFINPACMQARSAVKSKCQLQYLFNLDVVRAGVRDWSQVAWFRSANVFFDPAQGGIPVVHGPLGIKGEIGQESSSRLDLYTSLGEPSQHGTFKDKTFRVSISFAQFRNALRLITAKQVAKPPQEIVAADLRAMFGDQWGNPAQWVLLSTNVSQEVHNPDPALRAYIGGSVRSLYVGAMVP
jgi:hypothetical protein